MRSYLLTLIISVFSMTLINAQDITGAWKGALDVQGTKIALIFHLKNDNNGLTATMDSPDQGASGIPVDSVHFAENTLGLGIKAAGISYKGTLNNNTITGEFHQGGMQLPLVLTKTVITKPGDTTLPSGATELQKIIEQDKGNYQYRVEDYFARPKSSQFQLSPGGKFLSYMEKEDDGKRHVYVKEIATGKITRAIEEKEELIKGYGWINDERLVYVMDKGGNENFHIYAAGVDGSNVLDLTPFDGVQASIERILKDQKNYIIITMNKDNKQIFEPYKVNVVTGQMEKLYENKDVTNPIAGYDFDKDGNLRGFSKMYQGIKSQYFYKPSGASNYSLYFTTNWDDNFNILSFSYNPANPDEAYVLTNLDSDKARIILYDFKKKEKVKEIFSNKDFDVSSIGLSRKRNYEVDYYAYEGEKEEVIPVSETFKKIYNNLKKEFSAYQFGIAGKTDDESKYLVYVTSDRLVGKYYIYDAATGKITFLYDLMPQLKETDMAVMQPITFKSRDGKTIHGYITLPKAALEGKKVPLVVNPHGGPQGIRDSWGFNPETQLFASRGYATLQVNFRISGGYGKEFLRAGFKQIGRKLMDDIEDGVQYAIDKGWADAGKKAIYGGSHGGYATLMGLVKTPDLYTCGVDYVGVSNIETFFASFPEYWKPYKEMVKQIWYDLDNPEEAKIAKEVSPFYQLDKIKKPLLVVQGANDPRVNINESDQIVKALRAKGFDVPYIVKYNEGHGFQREENRIEFYKTMLGFLAGYLK
ncbi:peptidase S9 [Niabella ginsenosidivorans]|uniref:Peptidase S9 n=1 Tax=Niabella ginsenosidivorans TaxID=1176587 RepID=A0A1A9HY70_9BACT|nr:S9 family peptidase [Niabella ginsenosidivorans]ANH79769.1 peptidase S9 [Niabella ginsenosidivorans]